MDHTGNLRLSSYDYDLPQELIAQDPLSNRSDSRLMVMDRYTGTFHHHNFFDLPDFLREGDCLVLNNTRVIPARLIGKREGSGGRAELLLLKKLEDGCWETLAKPGKRLKAGSRIDFGDGTLFGEVREVCPDGNRIVEFFYDMEKYQVFEEVLDQLGEMPLPPYITHTLEDRERYQTVYARETGSAAAPTAGLHFTQELLSDISKKGVTVCELTLHVGLGTFRPVKEENLENHQMHSEFYQVPEETAAKINQCRQAGGRVIAVGTTTTRTLESVADVDGRINPGSGWTDIFLYPGYRFKAVDGLLTNFHLPKSTLIMLVSAFAGREHVLAAYAEAVRQRYRFFSFGDAMLLLPGVFDEGEVRHVSG